MAKKSNNGTHAYNMQQANMLKHSGIKISRSSMMRGQANFQKHNQEALAEAYRETKVLNMKRYFTKNKWSWPPKKHHILTICHLINGYYEKDICKHTPKDALEKKLNL